MARKVVKQSAADAPTESLGSTAKHSAAKNAVSHVAKKEAAKKKRPATRAVRGSKKTAQKTASKPLKKPSKKTGTKRARKLAHGAPRGAVKQGPRRARASSAKSSVASGYVREVLKRLHEAYPVAECALKYRTPEQLLIATILSAQTTDERVNQVTAELFRRYPTPAAIAKLPLSVLEKEIQSTGFFRSKAKNIKACCQQLVEHYGGKVPRDLEKLVQLPGVGRKTANVVLGTAFGIASGIVVDTHVGRIVRRLGLTTEKDPVKIERDLMELIPREEWIMFSHRLIHHGRQVCKSRKPDCDRCVLNDICPKIGVA